MGQITLFGNKENEAIDYNIKKLEDWIEELEWVISDENSWNERERVEWWLRNGGGILEKELEEEIKESIAWTEQEIGFLKNGKVEKTWTEK